MRPRITDDTYTTYKSAIKNYIVPQIGKMYMSTLNQGYIRKLYNAVAEKYESVAKNVRTIMKTSLEYAFNKNVLGARWPALPPARRSVLFFSPSSPP